MPAVELGESFNGVKAVGVSTLPTHRHHKARAAVAASLVVPFYFGGPAWPNTQAETVLSAPTPIASEPRAQAGALRVLPHLANFEGTAPLSTTEISAVDGHDSGTLIITSATPGEIVNLAAGTYRLTAHFENSNTEAITDVEVKAGILRSVDIALHAGLTHISLNKPALAQWSIMPDQGSGLMTTATNFDAVLKPGHYTADAVIDGRHIKQSFTVTDGEEQLVVLPN